MTAPMVLDGPAFLAYVEQVLAPTLTTRRPRGDGQSAAAQAARHSRGDRSRRRGLRYLPPYSPDFNPIENAFAKLKALLKKAAARTRDDLWNAIRDALRHLTPTECANYFTAAGYEPE